MIDERGYGDFLGRFLNPDYSFFDYKLKDLILKLVNTKTLFGWMRVGRI